MQGVQRDRCGRSIYNWRVTDYRLALIILNYRTPTLVIDCLASFAEEIEVGVDCAIVVDNASNDGSEQRIRDAIEENGWSAWAKLVPAGRNGGFSAGNNVGMRHVSAELYWLTNSDTLCRPGAKQALLDAFAANPRAGIIGPRLEWPDGAPQISAFRNITPLTQLVEAAKTGPVSKLFAQHEVGIEVSDVPFRPNWVSFASVVVRREVVAQIGYMDEAIFMYFEDTDYCRRAADAGWEIVYWPDAHVVHLRGGTSDVKAATKARKRRPAYYYEARTHYLRTFYGNGGWVGANLLWTTGRAISLLREAVGHKEPHTCAHEARDIWQS